MMKKTMLSILFLPVMFTVKAQVFQENMGVVTSNVSVSDHHSAKGFNNSNTLKFSGSGEVQANGSSLGKYKTAVGDASGGANVRIGDVVGTDLTISGINTTKINNPVLGFGVLKNTKGSTGSELSLEYSINGGKTWVPMLFPPLASGEGTGLSWYYRETSTLPKSDKLMVRFMQTSTALVFRIDDISVFDKAQ
jgi:hypothetical protein